MFTKQSRDFLEAGRQATARSLAAAYSPRVCDVYKTGAYWGFSILFRAAAPTNRNVYRDVLAFEQGDRQATWRSPCKAV